jgi:hypothetical protein
VIAERHPFDPGQLQPLSACLLAHAELYGRYGYSRVPQGLVDAVSRSLGLPDDVALGIVGNCIRDYVREFGIGRADRWR